ncbi:MAG: hypothetical protein ACE1ZA_20105 [Pseudomonadales bacterium]
MYGRAKVLLGAAPMIPAVPSVSVPVQYQWIGATSVDNLFPSNLQLFKSRGVRHLVEYRDAHLYEFKSRLVPSVAAMPVLLVAFQVPLFIVCDTTLAVVMHRKSRRVRWDRFVREGNGCNCQNCHGVQCESYAGDVLKPVH